MSRACSEILKHAGGGAEQLRVTSAASLISSKKEEKS